MSKAPNNPDAVDATQSTFGQINFACGADAVAYYYRLGYTTTREGEENESREMTHPNGDKILIHHIGFLEWQVEHIPAPTMLIDITDPANAGWIDSKGYVWYAPQADAFSPLGRVGYSINTPAGEGNGWFGKEHFKSDDFHAKRFLGDMVMLYLPEL